MDWKRKLGSRKFWALIAAFATSILTIFRVGATEITQVVGIITAFGSVAVYILVEGNIDAKSAQSDFYIEAPKDDIE